nr:uncharacterized protein LOC127331596 [Lolium perenne]
MCGLVVQMMLLLSVTMSLYTSREKEPAGNQIKRRMTARFKQKNLFGNLNLQACHFTFSGALILAHSKGVGYLLLLDCGPLSSSKCCMCEWQPRQPEKLQGCSFGSTLGACRRFVDGWPKTTAEGAAVAVFGRRWPAVAGGAEQTPGGALVVVVRDRRMAGRFYVVAWRSNGVDRGRRRAVQSGLSCA